MLITDSQGQLTLKHSHPSNYLTITLVLGIIAVIAAILFDTFSFFMQVSPTLLSNSVPAQLHISKFSFLDACLFYFFGYALMQIPSGMILDRFGAQRILSISMFVCALSTLCFTVATTLPLISISRLIMGISGSFAYIGVLFVAIRLFPLRYFSMFVGIAELAGAVGAVLAENPLRLLISHLGWHASFELLAFILIFCSVLIYGVFSYLPNAGQHPGKTINLRDCVLYMVKSRRFFLIYLISFLIWIIPMGFIAYWAVVYLRSDFHISLALTTKECSVAWIVQGVMSPVIAWWSNRIKQRILPTLVCMAIGFISALALIYLSHGQRAIIDLCMAGIGFSAASITLMFALIGDFADHHYAGSLMGFNNMLAVLAAPAGQLIIGFLTKTGHIALPHALLFFPACYLLAMLLLAIFMKLQKKH